MRAFSSSNSNRLTRAASRRQLRGSLTVCASANDTTKASPTPWSAWYGAFKAADSPAAAVGTQPQGDSLTAALELLQQAVDTEQYETAAKLRDASLAWLGSSSSSSSSSGSSSSSSLAAGWYRPVSNPQARAINSSSSLLYVSHSDPCRWTGLLLTPADFMHYDLAGNCNSSELEMAAMLEQSGRYGTPLFEVWVLPDSPQHHHQHQQQQQQHQEKDDPSNTASSSSSFVPVVVGLQSVNQAFNELLGVRPNRSRGRQQHPGPQEPRYINQRLLLLVAPDGGGMTAAAVHAGNDATLRTWRISTANSTAGAGTAAAGAAGGDGSGKTRPQQQQEDKQAAAVAGPFRPAELSGGVRPGLTIDGHSIDHLRGPGTLTRTGADSFSFCRQTLPADVLCALTCTSSSDAGSWWQGSGARLFRVDLQYQLPPAEPAAAASDVGEQGTTDRTAAAGTAAVEGEGQLASSSSAGGGPGCDRVAAELCSLLAPAQAAGSSSSGSLQRDLSALLAAAAVGTAPERGVVSEAQHAITVTEVPLQGDATAAGSGDGDSAAAVPAAAVEFERVSEPTASLSFGGWQVTVSLT